MGKSLVSYFNNYFLNSSNIERENSITFYNENMNRLTKGDNALAIPLIRNEHEIFSKKAILMVNI